MAAVAVIPLSASRDSSVSLLYAFIPEVRLDASCLLLLLVIIPPLQSFFSFCGSIEHACFQDPISSYRASHIIGNRVRRDFFVAAASVTPLITYLQQ